MSYESDYFRLEVLSGLRRNQVRNAVLGYVDRYCNPFVKQRLDAYNDLTKEACDVVLELCRKYEEYSEGAYSETYRGELEMLEQQLIALEGKLGMDKGFFSEEPAVRLPAGL